ncbi:MAG: hypothetical protein ABNH53_06145 [Henriciella sp.]|jgi:hypothetical protein
MADPKIQRFKAELFKAIEADPNINANAEAAVKANAEAVGAEIPDTKVYRWAVGGLVIVSILIVLGAILIWTVISPGPDGARDLPEFFSTIIAVAIGALASMLGYTRATDT